MVHKESMVATVLTQSYNERDCLFMPTTTVPLYDDDPLPTFPPHPPRYTNLIEYSQAIQGLYMSNILGYDDDFTINKSHTV